MKKLKEHKYLLFLYSRVDEFLSDEQHDKENLPDIIVSFCVVVEKLFKIHLHKKNPVLIFDASKFNNENLFDNIILEQENSIETAKIDLIISRYGRIFPRKFTDTDLQILSGIYKIRNSFIHGYKTDDKISFDSEDITKKIGTLWNKITPLAKDIFGEEITTRKVKKRYTEEELENILKNEVSVKINQRQEQKRENIFAVTSGGNLMVRYPEMVYSLPDNLNKCPRCGEYGFSLDSDDGVFKHFYNTLPLCLGDEVEQSSVSGLYKCKKCKLELTPKEYEIAKQIKKIS